MEYEITKGSVVYVVEPLIDDGLLYAVIRSARGLDVYGSDELSALFSEEVQRELARELESIMKKEGEEV